MYRHDHEYSLSFHHLDDILLNSADRINIIEHSVRQLSTPSLSSSPIKVDQNPYKLEVGSKIQHGDPTEYGVIKWIGVMFPGNKLLYAGVEMVSA